MDGVIEQDQGFIMRHMLLRLIGSKGRSRCVVSDMDDGLQECARPEDRAHLRNTDGNRRLRRTEIGEFVGAA